MPSFEEFHTSQKRQRAWKDIIARDSVRKQEDITTSGEKKLVDNKKQGSKDQNLTHESSMANSIGETFEKVEIQLFIVGLIYIDLVVSTIGFVLENDVGTLTNTAKIEQIVDKDSTIFRLISSLTNFTNFCFVIDICGLMYAFGLKFFTHIGYTIDFCITMTAVWNNLNNSILDLYFPVQFLGYFRCWRVARLVTTLVSNVEQKHERTQIKLDDVEIKLKNQKKECNRLEALKSNEMKLRKEVEKLVLVYKDEVETLKEALKIAALDVTAAATEESLKKGYYPNAKKDIDDEDEQDDDDEDITIDEEGDKFYDGQ